MIVRVEIDERVRLWACLDKPEAATIIDGQRNVPNTERTAGAVVPSVIITDSEIYPNRPLAVTRKTMSHHTG